MLSAAVVDDWVNFLIYCIFRVGSHGGFGVWIGHESRGNIQLNRNSTGLLTSNLRGRNQRMALKIPGAESAPDRDTD